MAQTTLLRYATAVDVKHSTPFTTSTILQRHARLLREFRLNTKRQRHFNVSAESLQVMKNNKVRARMQRRFWFFTRFRRDLNVRQLSLPEYIQYVEGKKAAVQWVNVFLAGLS